MSDVCNRTVRVPHSYETVENITADDSILLTIYILPLLLKLYNTSMYRWLTTVYLVYLYPKKISKSVS